MLKILSIGNSFSEDAHRYLYSIAAADGVEIVTYNLYIGGCSLQQHWENYQNNAEAYCFQKNGVLNSDIYTSISKALQFADWDIITLQQASHFSGKEETYHPYIENLLAAVKAQVPGARIYLYETWEYAQNSTHSAFVEYQSDSDVMFQALDHAYHSVAKQLNLPMIPVGPAVHQAKSVLRAAGLPAEDILYRDGFHLHLNYGRYLAAAVWYKTLCGKSVQSNTFTPRDAGEADVKIMQALKSIF